MKSTIMKSLTGIALCAFLFSFTGIGGESYTIHLNDKLVVQHYITSKTSVPSFSLDQASVNGQLSVYYNECGQIGKQRSLTIKDEKGTTLKEWSFANTSADHAPMIFKVKDVLALKQKGSNLKLFYASDRVSGGRLLATVILSEELKASR